MHSKMKLNNVRSLIKIQMLRYFNQFGKKIKLKNSLMIYKEKIKKNNFKLINKLMRSEILKNKYNNYKFNFSFILIN